MSSTLPDQIDEVGQTRPHLWAWLLAGIRREKRRGGPDKERRLLFLDDDPERARCFLSDHPDAVWVTTVPQCLDRLVEFWDEVHLDHDLGGKTFVDSSDTDCGMEVIRWLCKEPRGHLKDSLFFVHTHNATAGLLMVLQMRAFDYQAEFRPFGLDLERLLAHNEPESAAQAEPAPHAERSRRPIRRLLELFKLGFSTVLRSIHRRARGHPDRPSPPAPE